MSPQQRRDLRDVALTHISGPDGQSMIARMARSEVKNYLAELAEEAEMPFVSAAGFLRGVRSSMFSITNATDADDDSSICGAEPYAPGSEGYDGAQCVLPAGHAGAHNDSPIDAPFNVIDRWNIYDQETDNTVSPFTLDPDRYPEIVTLPSGHTTACTCPEEDKYPPLPQRVP
jgi:hypothetical protein